METEKNTGISEIQRRSLFFIFKELGFDDNNRHCFISDFTEGKTDSLKNLGYIEAQNMLRYLRELRSNPQERKQRDDLDRKRKGVMRAIGRYLELCGQKSTAEYIKSIAIRAAGMVKTGCILHDFNRIDGATLTRIYNEFCRKQSIQEMKLNLSKIN